ncbi:peptidoglycan-binding protein [Skermanella rosea]|uniref:peptidoglycan-binding protein n=1 Tax=Skermanella rosea TaxID=1817965 RepID=UPI001E3EF2A4|nr:peptidoglycan-binding protein [Skermanella rosea]UEM02340.1 peptidoglycan-binding protein [Skermanella rosea]
MRAFILPLTVLLAGCVTGTAPDGGPARRASGSDGAASPPAHEQPQTDEKARLVMRVQDLLALLGHDPGGADGIAGPATRSAMARAAADLRIPVPEEPDLRFARALESAVAERVRTAQRQLAARGYDPGTADGQLGPRTRQALARYRADNGLPDGPAIMADWPEPKPEPEREAKPVQAQAPAGNPAPSGPLTPGRRITVLLPGEPEGRVLTVGDDGTVEVPGMGTVQAAGRHPSEIEKDIAVGMLDRYIATLVGAVRVDVLPP